MDSGQIRSPSKLNYSFFEKQLTEISHGSHSFSGTKHSVCGEILGPLKSHSPRTAINKQGIPLSSLLAPGPGSYAVESSCGKQSLSTKNTVPAFSFDKADRTKYEKTYISKVYFLFFFFLDSMYSHNFGFRFSPFLLKFL